MTKEEAKEFGLRLLHGIMERNESYPVYANNVKQAIEALSETSGSSEIPNDLEEAARHSEILTYPMPEDGDIEKVFKVQEARVFHEIGFIAGAKWQKQHDAELIEIAYNDGITIGMTKQKEQMMKEAAEGRINEDCIITLNNGTAIDLQPFPDKDPAFLFEEEQDVHIIVLKKED